MNRGKLIAALTLLVAAVMVGGCGGEADLALTIFTDSAKCLG
jgi:hypothetical protein